MSRIGKKPINIPQGVEVKIQDHDILIKGPKGELKSTVHYKIKIEQKDNQLNLGIADSSNKRHIALWGLWASLINNMVIGVTQGYEKKLEIIGVGFKVALQGNKLVLNVGYSHPVEYDLPKGITAQVDKNIILISGIDKQLVGEVAAQIRRIKKPEPYKGKGIKYVDEVIIRKVGKAAAKGGD